MQNLQVIPKALDKIVDCLSQSKRHNLLSGLIVFFSATQLGIHFWPLSSLIYGIRVDYLSPTIYFLDLLIILYFLVRRFNNLRFYDLRIVVPIPLINLLYSQNPLSTLSWSLHFVLYLFFALSLSPKLLKTFVTSIISLTLTFSLFFQAIIAIIQVLLGHSVGGLMYYLGERTIAVGSPNIALATFMDRVVLRAYGTFSHPNVLAGFSIISLLIILYFYKNKFVFPLLFTTLLIFLTQSRSAAISLFGIIIPFYLIRTLRNRIIFFIILLFSIFPLLVSSSLTRSYNLSLSQRLDLQEMSLKVIARYPTFGTGTQASISTYPEISQRTRLLQPDHNSFTLFLSWFGLFGMLTILFVLREKLSPIFYLLVPLTPILALDHYLLTSPQGLFIIILFLIVTLNYPYAQKNL